LQIIQCTVQNLDRISIADDFLIEVDQHGNEEQLHPDGTPPIGIELTETTTPDSSVSSAAVSAVLGLLPSIAFAESDPSNQTLPTKVYGTPLVISSDGFSTTQGLDGEASDLSLLLGTSFILQTSHKSGIIVGLNEKNDEINITMSDLASESISLFDTKLKIDTGINSSASMIESNQIAPLTTSAAPFLLFSDSAEKIEGEFAVISQALPKPTSDFASDAKQLFDPDLCPPTNSPLPDCPDCNETSVQQVPMNVRIPDQESPLTSKVVFIHGQEITSHTVPGESQDPSACPIIDTSIYELGWHVTDEVVSNAISDSGTANATRDCASPSLAGPIIAISDVDSHTLALPAELDARDNTECVQDHVSTALSNVVVDVREKFSSPISVIDVSALNLSASLRSSTACTPSTRTTVAFDASNSAYPAAMSATDVVASVKSRDPSSSEALSIPLSVNTVDRGAIVSSIGLL
jgi:hypothetical protein